MKKVVITGGGTGGHAFPAVAIAEEFILRGTSVIYIGSPKGFESKLVPEKGIPYLAVQSGAVKNQGVFTIVKTLFRLAKAVWVCLGVLRREKPDAVIGVGGYVSVPASLAAYLLRIPLYLQEQNTSVGIANRVLGKLSRKIFLGFPQAETYFPKGRCLVTGNPIRNEFFNSSFPPFRAETPHLLILGGSQGAAAINDVMVSLLPKLLEKYPNLTWLHQTGQRDYDRVRALYGNHLPGPFEVTPFVHDVVKAYGKASLVIARSGALTVSELIQVGRPAIFVPYPRRGQNDQTTNAYYLERQHCARVVEQGQKFEERFWATFQEVFHPEILTAMATSFSALRRGSALATIAGHVEADIALKGGK